MTVEEKETYYDGYAAYLKSQPLPTDDLAARDFLSRYATDPRLPFTDKFSEIHEFVEATCGGMFEHLEMAAWYWTTFVKVQRKVGVKHLKTARHQMRTEYTPFTDALHKAGALARHWAERRAEILA